MFAGISLVLALAWGDVSVPHDLVSFEQMAYDIRAPLQLKILDLRKNYGIEETRPGQISFVGEEGEVVARARLIRALSDDQTERMERVTYWDEEGHVLIEEEVRTGGSALEYRSPFDKIFFAGAAQWALQPNENSKRITMKSDGKEWLKIEVSRQTSGTSVILYLGGTRFLAIFDHELVPGQFRTIRYEMPAHFWDTGFLHRYLSGYIHQNPELKIESRRPLGFLVETHEYFKDEEDLYGLNRFLNTFNKRVYKPVVTNGAAKITRTLANEFFPETEKFQDVAVSNQFLDELIVISAELDQAVAQPTLIPSIKQKISKFIADIQNGTLSAKYLVEQQ